VTKWDNDDLRTLAGMLESGQLKPAIDATYALGEARDAFSTYAEGHVRGKLVLTI
jgi:NADPH:quinone reductase-like Zn-dependent oxidoreductase